MNVCMYGQHIRQSIEQPGKVDNPAMIVVIISLRPFLTRKVFLEILGLEGTKFCWEKKTFLRGNFPETFPRPKFPQEILARLLPETRKFYGEILGSLDNRTEISTLSQYWMICCTHTCIESHKRCPKSLLTNVRGRTAVLAGIMIDFFCFQSGLVT